MLEHGREHSNDGLSNFECGLRPRVRDTAVPANFQRKYLSTEVDRHRLVVYPVFIGFHLWRSQQQPDAYTEIKRLTVSSSGADLRTCLTRYAMITSLFCSKASGACRDSWASTAICATSLSDSTSSKPSAIDYIFIDLSALVQRSPSPHAPLQSGRRASPSPSYMRSASPRT